MRRFVWSLCVFFCGGAVFAEDFTGGSTLQIGQNAILGVEASTTFAADLSDGSTGLDTDVGMELIFDLIPRSDKGVLPENPDTPSVRLLLKNASFTWWNTFFLDDAGDNSGSWDSDDLNAWGEARPLILTFDSLIADVIWTNYYFRVAGTKPKMEVDSASIKSIFDDVMDAEDRWYVGHDQALYYETRYNSLKLPLLGDILRRDLIDVVPSVAGMLGAGCEFDSFTLDLKAGSYAAGENNNDNAWVFGLDTEYKPITALSLIFSSLAAVNYPNNPYAFGAGMEYLRPIGSRFILKPFVGFDGQYLEADGEFTWEAGGGFYLYWRDMDLRVSHRDIDYDEVVPVGLSASMNLNNDDEANAIISLFEMAGEEALVRNLGGFFQVEIANIFGANGDSTNLAVIVQIEYLIDKTILPYVQERYAPGLETDGSENVVTDGTFHYGTKVGVLIMPMENFSIDVSYERDDVRTDSEFTSDSGVISTTFRITL